MTYAEAYRSCIDLQHQVKSSEAKEAIGIAAQCIEVCDLLLPTWQSPEKALPEKGEKVLAVAKSGSGNIIDTAFYEKECWVFRNWEVPQEDVIAWMKLPKFDERYIT